MPGSYRRYPWGKWLDGEPHLVHRVSHEETAPLKDNEYDIPTNSLKTIIYQAAKRFGKTVAVSTNGFDVLIQTYDPLTQRRPHFTFDDFESNKAKTPYPVEYMCVICGALAGQYHSDLAKLQNLPPQCWRIENYVPVGPLHD